MLKLNNRTENRNDKNASKEIDNKKRKKKMRAGSNLPVTNK